MRRKIPLSDLASWCFVWKWVPCVLSWGLSLLHSGACLWVKIVSRRIFLKVSHQGFLGNLETWSFWSYKVSCEVWASFGGDWNFGGSRSPASQLSLTPSVSSFVLRVPPCVLGVGAWLFPHFPPKKGPEAFFSFGIFLLDEKELGISKKEKQILSCWSASLSQLHLYECLFSERPFSSRFLVTYFKILETSDKFWFWETGEIETRMDYARSSLRWCLLWHLCFGLLNIANFFRGFLRWKENPVRPCSPQFLT